MLRRNPLLRYLSKPKKDEVFHSSGYARVQNSGNFGAADQGSFQTRQQMEQNRNLVRGYNMSGLTTDRGRIACARQACGQEQNSSYQGAGVDTSNQNRRTLGGVERSVRGMGVEPNDAGERMGYGRFNGSAREALSAMRKSEIARRENRFGSGETNRNGGGRLGSGANGGSERGRFGGGANGRSGGVMRFGRKEK